MELPPTWQFAKLTALHDDIYPPEFTIEPDVCIIGRSPSCQIIASRQIVSRLHARIERDERARYVLHDTKSANGTFVNDSVHSIQEPYVLQDNDTIGLGSNEPLLRFEDAEATAPMTISRLKYNKQKMVFMLDRKPMQLSPNQTRLLKHLYDHAYEICTRESCAKILWDREYDAILDGQALDRTISYLRRRFREISPDADLIQTRRGVGYILVLHV